METFSALLALCERNSPVTGEFPWRRPVTRSFGVFFDISNGWVNNRDAGDLRRHRAHDYVTVILYTHPCLWQHATWWRSYVVVCKSPGCSRLLDEYMTCTKRGANMSIAVIMGWELNSNISAAKGLYRFCLNIKTVIPDTRELPFQR